MYFISNLVHGFSNDKHSFMKQYESYDTSKEQMAFIFRYAKEHPMDDEAKKLVEELMDPQGSTVREQKCGLYLAIAYKYKKALLDVFNSMDEHGGSKFSSTIHLIAGYYCAKVLDQEELKNILMSNKEMPPKYAARVIHSIAKHCPKMINRDLVVSVFRKYGDMNAIVLLGGMKKGSDEEIAKILFQEFKFTYLPYHGRLCITHPRAILQFLEMVHEKFKKEQQQPKSYWEDVQPARIMIERASNTILLNRIARDNKESCKMVIELIKKWFVEPCKKWDCKSWVPDIILFCPEAFRLDVESYLRLLDEMDIFLYSRPVFRYPFNRLTVDHMVTLFDMFAKHHLKGKDDMVHVHEPSRLFIETFFLQMPRTTCYEVNRMHMFQRKVFDKYHDVFLDWLTMNMNIDHVNILYPELGTRVAEKMYEFVFKTSGPELSSNFVARIKYWRYMRSSLEDKERYQFLIGLCRHPNPSVRGVIMGSLLFCSLYNKVKIREVLQFLVDRMNSEESGVVNHLLNALLVPDFTFKTTVDVLKNLDVLKQKEMGDMFSRLLVHCGKMMDSMIVAPVLFQLVHCCTCGEEEIRKMTEYVHKVACNIDENLAFDLMTTPHINLRITKMKTEGDIFMPVWSLPMYRNVTESMLQTSPTTAAGTVGSLTTSATILNNNTVMAGMNPMSMLSKSSDWSKSLLGMFMRWYSHGQGSATTTPMFPIYNDVRAKRSLEFMKNIVIRLLSQLSQLGSDILNTTLMRRIWDHIPGLGWARRRRTRYDIDQLCDLFGEYFKHRISHGDYSRMAKLFKLSYEPWRFKKLKQCYMSFVDAITQGKSQMVPMRLTAPPIMILLSYFNKFVEVKQRHTLIQQLIQSDPSLWIVPAMQRHLLGRNASHQFIEKYLKNTENGTWSFAIFKKMGHKGEISLARMDDRVISLNPFVIREQRVEEHMPKEIVECITKMLISATHLISRSEDIYPENVNILSYLRPIRIDMFAKPHSLETPSRRMMNLVGELQIEKDEVEMMDKMIQEKILSKGGDRPLNSIPVMVLAMLAKTFSPYFPERHMDFIVEKMNPEGALYYYSVLIRVSRFIPRMHFLTKYMSIIDKKHESEQRNGIVQMLLVSHFKHQFRCFSRDEQFGGKIIDKVINMFRTEQTLPREVRVKLADIFITYLSLAKDVNNESVKKVLAVLETAVGSSYIEVPITILKCIRRHFFHDPSHILVEVLDRVASSKLLSHDHIMVQELTWRVLNMVIQHRMILTETFKKVSGKLRDTAINFMLDFDKTDKDLLVIHALPMMVTLSRLDATIFDQLTNRVMKPLLVDEKYEKLDTDVYNAKLEWDQPVTQRITLICALLTRVVQMTIEYESDEFIKVIDDKFIKPVADLMIKEDPVLYFGGCYKLRFAVTQWHRTESVEERLKQFVQDIVKQREETKENKDVWLSISSSTFIEEVLMGVATHRARTIAEAVANLIKQREVRIRKRQRDGERGEDEMDVLLTIMLHFAGEKMIWVNDKLRNLLRELRSRSDDNILLGVYSRRPIEIALRRRFIGGFSHGGSYMSTFGRSAAYQSMSGNQQSDNMDNIM